MGGDLGMSGDPLRAALQRLHDEMSYEIQRVHPSPAVSVVAAKGTVARWRGELATLLATIPEKEVIPEKGLDMPEPSQAASATSVDGPALDAKARGGSGSGETPAPAPRRDASCVCLDEELRMFGTPDPLCPAKNHGLMLVTDHDRIIAQLREQIEKLRDTLAVSSTDEERRLRAELARLQASVSRSPVPQLIAQLKNLPVTARTCPDSRHESHDCQSIANVNQAAVLRIADELEAASRDRSPVHQLIARSIEALKGLREHKAIDHIDCAVFDHEGMGEQVDERCQWCRKADAAIDELEAALTAEGRQGGDEIDLEELQADQWSHAEAKRLEAAAIDLIGPYNILGTDTNGTRAAIFGMVREALFKAARRPAGAEARVEAPPATFAEELQSAINRFSQENGSNTPDFILAQFLMCCLSAWNACVQRREQWYGRGAEFLATGGSGPAPHNPERILAAGRPPQPTQGDEVTISETIDVLTRMRERVGDTEVLFDCPSCQCAFKADLLEAEPIHVRIRAKKPSAPPQGDQPA